MRREYRRLASFIIVLFFSVSINFLIPRLVPGNPIGAIMSRMTQLGVTSGSPELAEHYKKAFALEGTILEQFLAYLIQLSRFNLGISLANYPTPVSLLIMNVLPYTLGLMLTSTILSWVVGTLLGGYVGWKGKESRLSIPITAVCVLFANVPYFILAMGFVLVFCFNLSIFPLGGAWSKMINPSLTIPFIIDLIMHALGPIICITLSQLATWFLHMRALITDIKEEDFISYGEARGLKGSRLLMSYAIRNCLLPQTTELGLTLGWIFSGSLLTEVVFNYPGLGKLLYSAIMNLDYPVIMGITLLTIIVINVSLLIMDLLIIPYLDPRVKED